VDEAMKTFGFALVILGIIALVYGGISYNRQKTIVDVGPLKATTTEQKSIPLSPIVGGVALIGGLVLLTAPKRLHS